ncbi:hypothetical protein [Burkholderia latens]|uniref:hypothetical protein n=1 Tax=Burkholderia latens TaxID=488446 RepID=UPI00158946FD|nr:hypothetical protein [Burkholderia latens]
MDLGQATCFTIILALVTVRTLLLKRAVEHVSPDGMAMLAGVGTVVCCLVWWAGDAMLRSAPAVSFDRIGMTAGLLKGALLVLLMATQQRLLGRSLSAATYVFPIAVGLIAAIEACFFATPLSIGAIGGIGTLFLCGLVFARHGHLAQMRRIDKRRFVLMVLLVVGFGLCDKIGIPRLGWWSYLLWTGIGSTVLGYLTGHRATGIPLARAAFFGGTWALPELFFNYSLQTWLPVAYGYFAIALRVPLLMFISTQIYGEGSARTQLMFGLLAVAGVALLFV